MHRRRDVFRLLFPQPVHPPEDGRPSCSIFPCISVFICPPAKSRHESQKNFRNSAGRALTKRRGCPMKKTGWKKSYKARKESRGKGRGEAARKKSKKRFIFHRGRIATWLWITGQVSWRFAPREFRGGGKNSQPPLKDENFVGSIGAQRELRPPGITEIRRVHSEWNYRAKTSCSFRGSVEWEKFLSWLELKVIYGRPVIRR